MIIVILTIINHLSYLHCFLLFWGFKHSKLESYCMKFPPHHHHHHRHHHHPRSNSLTRPRLRPIPLPPTLFLIANHPGMGAGLSSTPPVQ